MKRLSILFLTLAALAFMTSLNSCTNPTGSADNPAVQQTTDMPDLMVAGTRVNESDVTDGSMTQDMALVPPMMRQMKFMPFARILVELKLDSAQKVGIRALMAAHQDCMKSAMEGLRLAEQTLLDSARSQRKAILADLKAGKISRTDALVKLLDLNKSTRDSLANMPERAIATDAVKKCTDELFSGIRALLTDDQQVLWDKWVATVGDINNCGRGKGMGMGGRKH